MMRRLALGITIFSFVATFGSSAFAQTIKRNTAVLRWLDKTTARVETIRAPVNQSITIQTLQIIARTCVENPPEESPESAAFLDIWESKPGESAADIFRGWMFASSPALSAMEHPVYDIWVLGCEDTPSSASTTSRPSKDP